ncbi:hypothetical protein EG327_006124 [Venturia inaequalis]|uniref:Uncharacterized protein n=1 Tax=Venturia inaequalis TaxID=5025 RepID=A0A8H3V5Q3_VENIN|nr:hypothetical protein EG327_006124 [Venturia inaequalis]
MLFFLLAIITISLLFTQSSAENVTSVNQMIFALSGSRVSHAYENVFGSVIAADKNAITIVPQAGIGGYAPMQITAGIDKLISAPVPTITDSGAASCWGGNGRSSWTMLWSGLGITFLIIAVFG